MFIPCSIWQIVNIFTQKYDFLYMYFVDISYHDWNPYVLLLLGQKLNSIPIKWSIYQYD